MTRHQDDDRGSALVAAGAALLGLSVLADSGMEHYRGSFHNKAMALPLVPPPLPIAATAPPQSPSAPPAVPSSTN